MGFPYKQGEKYLSESETKDIDNFLKTEPVPDRWYENESGEKRRIHMMKLPAGVISPATVYGPWDGNNKEVGYRTIWSAPDYHGKTAAICYQKEDGEFGNCNNKEWMKWLGLGTSVEVKRETPEDKYTKARKEAIASGGLPKIVSGEEYDELKKPSKKGKWSSPSKKNK